MREGKEEKVKSILKEERSKSMELIMEIIK